MTIHLTPTAPSQPEPARQWPLSADRSGFRSDIQGLRAFAVVAVILDHLFLWPGGGFAGVDVFFVISGYLITTHLIRELDGTRRISLGMFYRRRARRIAPAAILVVLVTVCAALVVFPRERAFSTAIDGLWALIFGANWRSMLVGVDYFQLGQLPSALQHYWSLSVEEQFYFVWPVLMIACFAGGLRLFGSPTSARHTVSAGLAVVTMASFAWSVLETSNDPGIAYFSTFSRAWELGAGAVLALILPGRWRPSLAIRVAAAWTGIAGLIVSMFWITPGSLFPAPAAALPVLSTLLIIAAGSDVSEAAYHRALWPLTNRVTGYIGAISYSLYLWHFPVIVLMVSFIPQGSFRYVVVVLAATAALAATSYHLVEQPVRRSTWLLPATVDSSVDQRSDRRAHTRTTLVAIAASATVAAAVTGLGAFRAMDVPHESTPIHAGCFGAESMLRPAECPIETPVSIDDVRPSIDELTSDTAGGYSCWRGQGAPLATCTYGSTASDARRIALVGDSHAAALLPGLLPELEAENWSVTTYVGYGCQWRVLAAESDCTDVMDQIQSSLMTGGYDAVLTSSARWKTVGDPGAVGDYAALWAELAATGSRIIVIGDVPTISEEAYACVSRVGVDLRECTTSVEDARFPADPLVAAAARVADARLIDLSDLFCTASECPAVVGGVIVYRDTAGHVSGTYMKTMAPVVVERIAGALAG